EERLSRPWSCYAVMLYKDIPVMPAGSGSMLLHLEREDHSGSRLDNPGIREGSHCPFHQSDSAPAHPASRQGEAPLRSKGTWRVVALLVDGHLPRKCPRNTSGVQQEIHAG